MTVLSEYDRLECTGLWREGPDAQRREVVVSLGDATLVIRDLKDQALAHWSLPAIERLNPGESPALYGPGAEAAETLELAEDEMVRAIEKVRLVLARRRANPGSLRMFLVLSALIIFGSLAYTRLPGTLLNHTMRVVPAAKRAEIGQDLLARLTRIAGQPCRSALGQVALADLQRRVLRDQTGQLVVMPAGVRTSAHLPGGTILLGRTLVEDFEEPDVVAGYVLAEHMRREATDPMRPLLTHAGFMETFWLYTTGALSDGALDGYAEALLTNDPMDLADDDLLLRFQQAGISSAPYAYGRDPSGETTLGLIEADPYPNGAPRPVLPDGAWISLQAICAP